VIVFIHQVSSISLFKMCFPTNFNTIFLGDDNSLEL
jgi:hypothetical protein